MKYPEVVQALIGSSNCDTYLELGVHLGTTFHLIVPLVKRAIGVDISDNRIHKEGEFYEKSTDVFFKHFTGLVDVVFIDADHSFPSVKKDLLNSLNVLTQHGFIILHDTDPRKRELLTSRACGDAYKIVDYIRNLPEIDMVTLPVARAGITLVAKANARRVLEFT